MSRWSRSASAAMSVMSSRETAGIELLAAAQQDLAPAVDRRDRRPQLVRQDADERVAQVVVLEPVGDVGQDGDRRLLALRLEGADREVDRERRPVLAQRVASPGIARAAAGNRASRSSSECPRISSAE